MVKPYHKTGHYKYDRTKKRCPECEGVGHGKQFHRVTNLGFMGIHETETCPTCRGSGRLKQQWVADD